MNEVHIEPAASSPLAVVRRQCSFQDFGKVIPDACGVVWNVIREEKVPGAGRHVALDLDDVCNLEVGVELQAPWAGHGEVFGSATPAGRVATATHFGPYHQLATSHQAIRQWCVANGHALAGPSWELYGHWLHEWCDDPSKIRTDVYYLLKS
ncbi:MAG TPA: GyrI-like domain-containing protein [Gemmataceae bacterium]|nr:GyrI-like domain-containing protein [Gemmataceae bacterium]